MNSGLLRNVILGAISLFFFGALMSKLVDTGIELPAPMERPDYVPESAVQRISARLWFDCAPSTDKQANHFDITIYDGDEEHVRYQKQVPSHPEIVGQGTFELSGPTRSVGDIRRLIKFYDGELIYLKNGNVLEPVYRLSSR